MLLKTMFSLISESHLPKNIFLTLQWNEGLKNDEKCFLFDLNSSLRSQDIQIFVLTFCSCRKNGLIRKNNFKIHDVTNWLKNNCNTHIAVALISHEVKAMKL